MDLMGRGDGCTWVQPGTPKLDTHHFHCADRPPPSSPASVREQIRVAGLGLAEEEVRRTNQIADRADQVFQRPGFPFVGDAFQLR